VGVFNGELYSGGDAGEIIKWNIDDGNIIKRFPNVHDTIVTCLAFKYNFLFSGSVDSTVVRWNTESGMPLLTYLGKNTKLRSLALWKTLVITGGENGELKLWDASINSVEFLAVLAENLVPVNTLFVYQTYLYSGGSDKVLSQWNLTAFELVKKLDGKIHEA
jgi:WD40 repeat protein